MIGSYNRIEQFRVDEDKRFIPLNEDGEIEGDHPLKTSGLYDQTLDEVLLLNEAGNAFSPERVAEGTLTPVFFGSALTNFGVQTFLETYLQFAPAAKGTQFIRRVKLIRFLKTFRALCLKFKRI